MLQHNLLTLALLTTSVVGQQITTSTVEFTSPFSQSCQNANGSLTGDVAAGAELTFTYDQATGKLTLVVANTSPIVAGEENPLITQIHFNAPRTVTGMTLLSQSAPSGTQPNLAFSFGSSKVGCLGSYRANLTTGRAGAIANELAPRTTGPATVTGPVTFELQLAGGGLGSLNAEAIAYAFNQDSNLQPSSVGLKFQSAGVNGEESGFLGNGGDCVVSFYTSADPRIGTTFDLCQSGPEDCHDCMWVSATKGPVTIGGIEFPIGLPIIWGFDFGEFDGSQEICQSITLPNDPGLVGVTFYFAAATFPASNRTNVSLSKAFELTIVN